MDVTKSLINLYILWVIKREGAFFLLLLNVVFKQRDNLLLAAI